MRLTSLLCLMLLCGCTNSVWTCKPDIEFEDVAWKNDLSTWTEDTLKVSTGTMYCRRNF